MKFFRTERAPRTTGPGAPKKSRPADVTLVYDAETVLGLRALGFQVGKFDEEEISNPGETPRKES